MRHMPHLTPQQEAERILSFYGETSLEPVMAMLERQFVVLHNRAQVLLALCGVVITTTGFSGRLIAGTNPVAQWLIILGLAFALLSAAVVVWGVLHLRWLTMQAGNDLRSWLDTSLTYRDRKTRLYRVAIVLMLVGLVLYAASIAVMLLNPHEGALAPR